MDTLNQIISKLIDNKIVFTKEDLNNLNQMCNISNKYNFEFDLKNYNNKNYKISKNFFGKEYFHPKDINPYRTNYNVSSLMAELKLNNQKISDNEKIDKIINYIKLLNG